MSNQDDRKVGRCEDPEEDVHLAELQGWLRDWYRRRVQKESELNEDRRAAGTEDVEALMSEWTSFCTQCAENTAWKCAQCGIPLCNTHLCWGVCEGCHALPEDRKAGASRPSLAKPLDDEAMQLVLDAVSRGTTYIYSIGWHQWVVFRKAKGENAFLLGTTRKEIVEDEVRREREGEWK